METRNKLSHFCVNLSQLPSKASLLQQSLSLFLSLFSVLFCWLTPKAYQRLEAKLFAALSGQKKLLVARTAHCALAARTCSVHVNSARCFFAAAAKAAAASLCIVRATCAVALVVLHSKLVTRCRCFPLEALQSRDVEKKKEKS